jgi:hypothetical protein
MLRNKIADSFLLEQFGKLSKEPLTIYTPGLNSIK